MSGVRLLVVVSDFEHRWSILVSEFGQKCLILDTNSPILDTSVWFLVVRSNYLTQVTDLDISVRFWTQVTDIGD